jgi:hypothetical protein
MEWQHIWLILFAVEHASSKGSSVIIFFLVVRVINFHKSIGSDTRLLQEVGYLTTRYNILTWITTIRLTYAFEQNVLKAIDVQKCNHHLLSAKKCAL